MNFVSTVKSYLSNKSRITVGPMQVLVSEVAQHSTAIGGDSECLYGDYVTKNDYLKI